MEGKLHLDAVTDDELHVRYDLFDTSLIEQSILVPGNALATLLRAIDAWLREDPTSFALAHPQFVKSKTDRAFQILHEPSTTPELKICLLEQAGVLVEGAIEAFVNLCGDHVAEPTARTKRRRIGT